MMQIELGGVMSSVLLDDNDLPIHFFFVFVFLVPFF